MVLNLGFVFEWEDLRFVDSDRLHYTVEGGIMYLDGTPLHRDMADIKGVLVYYPSNWITRSSGLRGRALNATNPSGQQARQGSGHGGVEYGCSSSR